MRVIKHALIYCQLIPECGMLTSGHVCTHVTLVYTCDTCLHCTHVTRVTWYSSFYFHAIILLFDLSIELSFKLQRIRKQQESIQKVNNWTLYKQ